MSELKILSLNCRGLGSPGKRRDVLDYLKTLHYDIYLLQDTHLTDRKVIFFDTIWHGKCYHSVGTHNSRGTSILFNPKTQHKIIHEEHCSIGNYNIVVFEKSLNTYTIVNLYGPNEDRPAFFEQINQRLNDIHSDNIIIGGDFNFVLDHERDSNYHRQNNPRARDTFKQIVEEQGLLDAWTVLNPGKQAFTWSKTNPHKFGRLDMFFISEHLLNQSISCDIETGYRSDHSIITLRVKITEKKKGPGLWKLNESLLKDELYDKIIKELIVSTVTQYAVPIYSKDFVSNQANFDSIEFTISGSLFYETLLMLIRGETVKYSKRKTRESRERESIITSEVRRLQEASQAQPTPDNLSRLENAKKSLEEIRKPRIEGMITRSRVNWHEDGEKCSKYFLSLEKRNAARNSIQHIKVNNLVITKKEEILEQFSENLRNKYSKNNSTSYPNIYLSNNVLNKLTEDQKKALDSPMSLNELHVALMAMKKGKSPGSNGFTADFFKHFWEYLGVFLYRAWLENFEDSRNIDSHNLGIVTLIPKAGSPHKTGYDSLKGWRPITLLNVDFKIISAAVANRIKSVIDQLVSPSQTAYIQGRFIGENSRLVYDVIEHLNNSSGTGIIMAVDFTAAFDTVSWEFLSAALDSYNFGPYLKRIIQVM